MGSYHFYWISLIPTFCWDFKFANHGSFGCMADDHEPCEHSPPWSWVPGKGLYTNSSEGAPGSRSRLTHVTMQRVSLSCSCQPWTWMWTPLGTKQICLPFQATQGSQGHLTQVDGETVCPHLPLRWLCSEVKARPVSISWKNSHSAPAEPTHEDPVRVYRACGALTHTRCWWRMLGTLPYFLLWIYYFLLLKYFLQSVKFGSSQNLNLYVLFLNVLRVDTWK